LFVSTVGAVMFYYSAVF